MCVAEYANGNVPLRMRKKAKILIILTQLMFRPIKNRWMWPDGEGTGDLPPNGKYISSNTEFLQAK